jgi:hypothetical protein
MTHQSLSSTTFPALRVPEPRFARVFKVCATMAPILLVIYAYVISTDSMVRAHIDAPILETHTTMRLLVDVSNDSVGVDEDP